MERLTEYDEFGNAKFAGIDNTKLYEKLVCDETVALTTAIDKLGKLEDALEEFELTSAEDLRNHLNLQDNQIKAKEKEANTYAKEIVFLDNKIKLLERENQQLKQQLHDLPKKIVGDIADELGDCGKAYLECEPYIKICIVKSILQAILKKYGDKNESNND